MANHPNRSRAPSADGALITRRALNLDHALEHDAQIRRAAAYGGGSPEDRRARDSARASLDAELAPALAAIGLPAWRIVSAVNRRYGRDVPAGSSIWLDRGADASPYREARLVLRESGWHLMPNQERHTLPVPGLDAPASSVGPQTAPPVLRLPGGAGYTLRFDASSALCLDPLSFEDALAHMPTVEQ